MGTPNVPKEEERVCQIPWGISKQGIEGLHHSGHKVHEDEAPGTHEKPLRSIYSCDLAGFRGFLEGLVGQYYWWDYLVMPKTGENEPHLCVEHRRFYHVLDLSLQAKGGEANDQVHKPAGLHGSVSLAYSPSHKMGTEMFITWKFAKNGRSITILDNTENAYYIYDSQVRDRLLMSIDLFTLTIKDLTMADSGVYSIDVTDRNGNTEYSSFIITVYEPVPLPSQNIEVAKNTIDRCNFTLRCSVPPNTSDLFYAWVLSSAGPLYELNAHKGIMQMTLNKKDSRDILCKVHNLTDQKNVSILVQDLCADGRSLHLLIIKSVQCLLFTVPLIIYLTIIGNGRKGSTTNLAVESTA
ncbi:CD48 antigen-like [Leptodactylus fuscus]|uniref:CD48 antigen-like n=1 Tax=Leptodactylus fuscus TaxID=238119 RepID=UPI003F4E5F58